jgi:asparagine synthase (glutamine-hydrolysing)
MCGICGFIGKGSIEDLKAMSTVLFHRGPDEEGLWHDTEKAIFLGHRRLSIIDISGGSQPMWSADGNLGVVFNGEIYNHIELRNELQDKGYVFQSDHSDTEVLLHGFREWGKDLPVLLNGMWAFAIYDRTCHRLFLSRDRFGKKPLFYTLQNSTFAFASELNALTRHKIVKSSISKKSLKKYFAYGYIPAPHSIYENIYKLPGGYNLILDIDSMDFKVRQYWDFILEPFDKVPEKPEDAWGEELRMLIDRSVKRRLMSDVPLGVFLSGGIDSSSIVAFASKHEQGVRTFSIGFEEASFDESAHAKRVAEFFHTKHYSEVLSVDKSIQLLPSIVSRLDEPMGDSSLLPTYLLSMVTRKKVTVALGGDGADELFAGYDPFQALQRAKIYSRITPRPLHRAIRMIAARLPTSHSNMSFDFKLRRTLRGLSYPMRLWNSVWLGPLSPKELGELFQEPTEIEDVYEEAILCWEGCTQNNLIDKTLQFYTKLYLQDDILVKIDRASMMHSLEVRAPYLDKDLVDFVRKIPSTYKFRNRQTKYILKKALEPILPKDILYRSKKGFGVPIGKWFMKDSLPWKEFETMEYLNENYFNKKLDSHKNAKEDHRAFLWNAWLLNNMNI